MTREELIEELKAAGLPAIPTEVVNNGITFEGITLELKDPGKCSPLIYTKQGARDLLEEMEDEGNSRRDIFLKVHKILSENTLQLTAEELLSKENLESGLRIGLQQASDEDLMKRPTEFPGIEQYLYFELPQGIIPNMDKDGSATVKLRTPMKGLLPFSEEELYEIARKNTFAHTQIKTLDEMLMDMPVYPGMKRPGYAPTLHIATNDTENKGASAILDRAALAEYAKEKGFSKIVVFPSSIHEVLFMEADEDVDLKDLSQMVVEINQSTVSPEEVLGNEAFEMDLD